MAATKRRLPRGTVSFLFTDIAGSTRLAQTLDAGAYRRLIDQHNALLRAAILAHAGVERGTQGDAFLVIFRDARSAVSAAIDAQRALAGANWPSGVDLRVRMGLHSGEGIRGGDDYIGVDINRAARIAAVAHGGQILVSDSTRALAERNLPPGASFRDMGRHRLKDLEQPEHLFQLAAEGLAEDFPPLASAEARPGNLPVRLTSFVGREPELAELERLIADARLLTLSGPGGTGKTSLAVELARRLESHFPDGVWFVPLDAVSDPDLVASAIVGTIPLAEPGRRSPKQRLVEDLAGRKLLLVLDNFEQVVEAGALVGELLRSCPEPRFVVTSRAMLRISGEQEYEVLPLPVRADEGAVTAGAADKGIPAAVRLFIERARAVAPSFAVTDENRPAIVDICTRLDGLPLGIELAAARVNLLPPRAILERLEQRLPLPGHATRDVPERQRTLDAAIRWSYDLLDESHRRLLRRLSVFVGGCRIEEAERVCGPAGELGIEPVDGLMDLVDQSLVRRDPSEEPRVSMLETVRAFARDRLAEDPDEGAILRRHRAAYRDLAESVAPHLTRSDQRLWYGMLDREIDNIRAAVRHSIEHGEPVDGLRIAGAAWRHWVQRGYLAEGEELISSLLAASSSADDRSRVLGHIARGSMRYWRGSQVEADEDYSAAVEIARRTGESELLALGLYNLAFMSLVQPERREVLDEAIAVLTQRGDPQSLAYAVWLRMTIARNAGDVGEMRARALEGLALFRQLDEVMYTGMCLGSLIFSVLGQEHPDREELRQGLAWGLESLRLYHAVGDVTGTVVTLFGAAQLLSAVGELGPGLRTRAAAQAVADRYRVQIPPSFAFQLGAHPTVQARNRGMSEQEIERYLQEGAQLPLTEATEEVLALHERLLDAFEDDVLRKRAVEALG
jgi:predicted ATPase/class 3 adenylate cyclase